MRLSSTQRMVLQHMRDGWSLRYQAYEHCRLYPPVAGAPLMVSRATFRALCDAGYIEPQGTARRMPAYALTDAGRAVLEEERAGKRPHLNER